MPFAPTTHPRHRSTALLAALTLLAACDDPLAPEPPTVATSVQAIDASTAEQAALRELTRAVAMAMDNQGLRQQVKSDMRASRVTLEHKLHLGNYLKGRSGGILLTQIQRAAGLSRDSVQKLVAAVRPLEFYVPVAEHRESWVGGAEVIVASAFDDTDTPVGFDVRGERVSLDLAAAPANPVIALVPVETDFTAPLEDSKLRLQGRKLRNTNDQGGEAIGTYAIEPCPDCGIASLGTVDDGVYLVYAGLRDYKEGWLKGAPELETHLHGPRDAANPQYGEDLTCAGDRVSDARRFYNQDKLYFYGSVGSDAPLLADRRDLNQHQAKFPGGGRLYTMWEDDNEKCVIRTDFDMVGHILDAVTAAGASGASQFLTGGGSQIILGGNGTRILFEVAKVLIRKLANADFLRTNDDFIGSLILAKDARNYSNTMYSHVVMDGGTFNGYAQLHDEWASPSNGRPYMSAFTTDIASIDLNLSSAYRFGARASDQYGNTMSGHPIGWRQTNPLIAYLSEDGVIVPQNAGNTTVIARACDPTCVDRSIEVRVTGPSIWGPSYMSEWDPPATISGTVINPRHGSYWYQWTMQKCTNGSTCPTDYWDAGSGWNGPGQVSVSMSMYDAWTNVRLAIYTSPGGELIGEKEMTVYGPNKWPGTGCDPYYGCDVPWSVGEKPAGAGATKPSSKAADANAPARASAKPKRPTGQR